MKVDVLVLGGGSAGLAAAVTAARAGARTLVIERQGMLGGMGTVSLVHTFCGLYLLDAERPEIANPGLCGEIADRTRARTGLEPVKMGRCWVLPQHPVEFARLADELVAESGARVRFHSEAVGLEPTADGWKLRVACRGMLGEIEAGWLIDASGDAVAAALLGWADDRAAAEKLQRPAYVAGLHGLTDEVDGLALAGRLVDGVRSGTLPKDALGLHFRGSGRPGEAFATLDLSGEEGGAYDPTSADCLSALEATGRAVISAAVGFLRDRQPGWENACVAHWPARAGVRESRRWRGRETLTGEAILAGERRDDEVVLATWPLELRETNRGPRLRYPAEGRPAGIPAGALLPQGLERIAVAGRCLSCDHEAQASIRVMGTCFATGEAAAKLMLGMS